jgi:hypothetical protein
MSQIVAVGARLERLQRRSFIIGGVGLAICAVAGFFNPAQFFRSYLVAFLFWSGIPLGCLAVLMLHHLVGGGWGFLIRRLLEAGTRTLPVVAALVVPLLLGIPQLYIWAHPEAVAADPLLLHKRVYLNVPFFVVRTVLYFVVWIVLAHFLNRWSADQDDTGAASLARRLYALSGPGLVVYGLTVTFASLDWAMSLEPDWFSTIYSAVFMVGQVLSALAFVTAMLMFLASSEPLSAVASPRYLNDLGNLLLAFVILWAYMAFSQFLIIWSGNLTDEISWYLHRVRGGWQWVAAGVLAFHFGLPFLLLLSREIKRNVRSLSLLAGALLFMRLLDMVWNVDPAFDPARIRVHWTDWVASLGVGGIWIACFVRQLARRPLVPLHDPELPGILAGAAEGTS